MDKILVIDDEAAIVEMIEEFLSQSNFKIIKGYSRLDALAYIDETVDLVLLDISLGNNQNAGFEVCKEIRENYKIPIIFLSAKTTSLDKVTGFNAGGDDYITKPFDPMELIARINANLRRYKKYDRQKSEIIRFKDLSINAISKRVFINEKEINLTQREYELLYFLLKNRGKIISREEILKSVWAHENYDINVVNTNIMRLRNKLSSNKDDYIKSVHSRGYVIKE
jgi:DNA-binding response OmpR family regulator